MYANGISYNSSGAIERLRLGNGKWETTSYNNRLQVTEIGLDSSATDKSLLKLEYDYGTNTQNNSSLRSQKISFSGLSQPFEQTYTYDSLNRLKDAKEMIGTTEPWKQTFTFDRYGNRNFDEVNTTTLPKNCGTSPNFTVCTADKKVLNPLVNTSNNRLITSDHYTFDSSGNTTEDAQSRKFTYDGENKQTKVETVNSGGNVTDTIGVFLLMKK